MSARDYTPKDKQYIGDGVYVTFDGYQLWLSTGSEVEQIALEPQVFESLVLYAIAKGFKVPTP